SDLGEIRVNEAQIRSVRKPSKPKPERCLILGWNRSGAMIVRELDNYTPKGSQTMIVSEDNSGVKKRIEARSGKLKNQEITMVEGDTTDRALLDSLGIEEYDHVIVLANEGLDAQAADAKTLLTLLHLRDIAGKDETPFSIVSEMRDLRNRELAKSAKVDDFIVSEHLISLMMAQLSEDAELYGIFTELFDPEGAEVYLKPIGEYVTLGEAVNFYTVVEAAKKRNETAIGYRLISEAKDESKSYGVHTNPKKSETAIFSAEDKIIVFSED
ncbi:MAG TPA: NAD-binding protein, partial [Anaerolineales bacterium]|nr:NAD-binding protein [Anaerolineales bacterium]